MKANKMILCLDWSNILFRSLFINQLYGNASAYNNIEDCRSFIFKFATDVCSIINIFKPNKVVLLSDSRHAWRKDVLPGVDGYKSNREKDKNINWDNIFKCADDLKNLFKQSGCYIAEVDNGEADDMAALIKELLIEKYANYNCIIVSADADLRQLIHFNKDTHQYCAVYNTTIKSKTGKRYFYVNDDFINWYNTDEQVDIFFNNVDDNKKYIKDILTQNTKIELAVENPNEVLLHKIFCGDDGDCVPSFYSWAHNGKFVRITPAKERKIREKLAINTVNDLILSKDSLKPVFETICKKEINDIDISERLLRQRTLVELNSNLFPEHIKDYKDTIDYMLQEEDAGFFINMKAADILKGTEYENADKKKAIMADVFKDINKYGLNQIPIF